MDQTGSARSYPTSTTAWCGKERKAQRPEKDRTKMSSSAFQNFGPSWPMVVPSQAKAGEAIDPNGAWLLGRARHTLSYSCMGTAANATEHPSDFDIIWCCKNCSVAVAGACIRLCGSPSIIA
eukprot:352032-Chlamydomonas_euryale.AAC.3